MTTRVIFIVIFLLVPAYLISANAGNVQLDGGGSGTMPAQAMLAVVFGSGIALGLLLAWPRKRRIVTQNDEYQEDPEDFETPRDGLSDEDRQYIS